MIGEPEDRTLEEWARTLTVRSARLENLIRLNAPEIIIQGTVDMIRTSLAGVEHRLKEPEQ